MCCNSQKTLSLPGQQIAILSAENIITAISYSRTEECEVKEIRRFTSSATLEIWHNGKYYLQSVGGKVDWGKLIRKDAEASLCKPVAGDFLRQL